MPNLQALREKRRELAAKIRVQADKMNANGYSANAEDDGNWKAVNEDYNVTLAAVTREETAAAAEESNRPDPTGRIRPFSGDDHRAKGGDATELGNTDQLRTLALAGWMKAQSRAGMSEDEGRACAALGLNPHSKEIGLQLYSTEDYRRLQRGYRQAHPEQARDRVSDFKAALTQGSGPGGGYLIAPEQLRQTLEINMLAYGGIRQVAETIRTTSGEPLSWPTADDTTNAGVQLGESASIGTSVDPTFGKVLWSAYKFSSKPILVPSELLQDAVFNLPAILGEMLGVRLGRITNTKFTNGTGAATPKGIITCATTFAASTTAIVADDIIGLVHSVDPAYRGGAGFMLHDSIVLALRKLKDGIGQYLWQTGARDGVPDKLFGYGLTNNQDMDSATTTGKKSILFGQLSKYKIRTVGEVRMFRLEERYRDTDQDAFIAFTREDGNLLTAGTAPVKVLLH